MFGMCIASRQLATSAWRLEGRFTMKIGNCGHGINMGMDKIAREKVMNANQRGPEEHPFGVPGEIGASVSSPVKWR